MHPGTRGSTGTDETQRELLEGRDQMLDRVAERLEEIAGRDALIILGGIPAVSARLEELVTKAAPGRILRLEHLDVHTSEAMLAEAANAGAADLRDARDTDRISLIVDRAGARGLGILGAAATRSALAADSVHELFVTRTYLEDHAPDAEAAVGAAFDQAAGVEEVSGGGAELLDSFGGIGASLRFRAPDLTEPQSTQRANTESRPERPERRRRPHTRTTL
jgi:stalled ribosome rescue protein Dom34